jgi:hypothetical protein
LCEDAATLLVRLTSELGVAAEVTMIDLVSEPDFEADYGFRVPVIEAETGASLEAPIREDDLRTFLRHMQAATRETER